MQISHLFLHQIKAKAMPSGVLLTILLFLITVVTSCDKNNEKQTGALPPSWQNVREVGTCAIPQGYPFLFEPTLAVKNGKVTVGYIAVTSSPFENPTSFSRRVFFTDLNTTISPRLNNLAMLYPPEGQIL